MIGLKSVASGRSGSACLSAFGRCSRSSWRAPLWADALDGQFEVRSAFINISSDVYLLHADVQYPFNDDMRQALTDGVSLDFDLQAAVFRERRYWFDNDVVN